MSNGEIRVSITEIPKIREALEKADKEIERLNNNWNKLEEEISKHIALCTDITLNDILDLMKKLKGEDKE